MSSADDGSSAANIARRAARLPRSIFDTVEQPVTRASESAVQSAPFMDALAFGWRLGRRAEEGVRRGLDVSLGVVRLASRGDVDRLSNELARVERELRALRRELASGDSASGPEG